MADKNECENPPDDCEDHLSESAGGYVCHKKERKPNNQERASGYASISPPLILEKKKRKKKGGVFPTKIMSTNSKLGITPTLLIFI